MRTLVAGNWKMHKTAAEAVLFARDLHAHELDVRDVDALICPPFVALHALAQALADSPVEVGAQTMHWAESGAYTGEISASMVRSCGARWVIVGHSERRAYCNETDQTVNAKVMTALRHDLVPIVAVGETHQEHAAGLTRDRVVAQTRAALAGLTADEIARCVIAYEPIWAIGSGSADNPTDANLVMGEIRACAPGLQNTRILYGGSVKPDNIAAFVAQRHIDGALVGGASLDAHVFAALVQNARKGIAA